MIHGAVHRYPGIYLTGEEISEKTSARKPPMQAVRPVIASNDFPLHPNKVGRIAQQARKGDRRKKRKGRVRSSIA